MSDLANDMSVMLGQDVESAATWIEVTLENPSAGIAALHKVGIALTEEQRDRIASLTESGDRQMAQRILVYELTNEFGVPR